MGHIKEPKGVDFIIQSEPLTKETRKEISDFIKEYKNKVDTNKPKGKTNHPVKKVLSN